MVVDNFKRLRKRLKKKFKSWRKSKTAKAEEAVRAAAAEMEEAAAEATEQLMEQLRQELAGAQEQLRIVRQALQHAEEARDAAEEELLDALARAGRWNFNFGTIMSTVTGAAATSICFTFKIKVAFVLGPAVVAVGGGVYLLNHQAYPPQIHPHDHEEIAL
jgi:acyl-CoA reductase-like NAD-dependent aldehyde dehydrogenase